MHYRYRNDLAELSHLAADIEAFVHTHKLDPEVAHIFNLCLDELFTNIVSYGYTDQAPHEIELELNTSPLEMTAVLRDDARAFDPLTQAPQPDMHSPIEERKIGGLGVYFVKTLMSRVHYHRAGQRNVIELSRRHDHKHEHGQT